MKYAETDHRWVSRTSRLAFLAGAALLVPGTGLALRAHSSADGDADVAVAAAPTVTVTGVVHEKGTGRPVAGAHVSVLGTQSSAITDKAGRYSMTDIPEAREYNVCALPKRGEPYLITSRSVGANEEGRPVTVDLEFVRGIPFRVRVLDKETGKPLQGKLSYFPINPNNPFERGAMGYAAGGKMSLGAFYEASTDDHGEFLGAVLSGPGILGFSHPYRPGDESRADRKPVVSFPDGKENIRFQPNGDGAPFASVPVRSDPISWTFLTLGQYDAVIAIDPREGAEVVNYSIRIAPAKAPE